MFSKNTLYYRVISIVLVTVLFLCDLRLDYVKAEETPKDSKKLTVDKLFISPQLGIVSERYQGEKDHLFILIQDLHCTPDAQRSIANLVQFFIQSYRIRSLALEGATGLVDPKPLGSFPEKGLRETILNYLLEEGSLTGAEWAAARIQTRLELWGVEDPRLYYENLKAYQKAEVFSDKASHFLSSLKRKLQKIKRGRLSEHLFRLDEVYWKYRDGKQNLNPILELLEDEVHRRGLILPKVLRDYIRLIDFSIRVDSKKLNREIRTLIDKISENLAKDDLKKFLKAVMTYRLEKGSEIDFLKGLITWSKKKGIDLRDFPQFQLYSEGLELQSKISLKDFRSVLEKFTTSILSEVSWSLFEKTRRWQQLRDLLMLKLSSSDWTELANLDLYDYFSFLIESDDQIFLVSESPSLKEWINQARSFYEVAERRNKVLFHGTLKLMKKRDLSSVIMISGGFHTEGVKKEIRRRGFSYVVVLPVAKHIASSHYRERLLIHPSGFDLLFSESLRPLSSEKQMLRAEHHLAPALRTAVEPFHPGLRPLILKKAFLFYTLLTFWESGIKPSQMSLDRARDRLLSSVRNEEKEFLEAFLDSLEMGRIENHDPGRVWIKGTVGKREWIFVLGKNLKTSPSSVKVVAEGSLKEKEGVFFKVFQASQQNVLLQPKRVSAWVRMGKWLERVWKKSQLLLSNRFGLAGFAGMGSGLTFIVLYGYAMLTNPSYRFGLDYLSKLGVGRVSWPFNLSLMLAGTFLMVFGWLSLKPLLKQSKMTDIGLALLSLSGFFLACVGAFPANLGLVHVVAAVGFFCLISIALLLLAKPMAKSPVFGSSLALGALITVLLSILLLVTLSPAVETAVVLAHFFGIYLTSLKLLKVGSTSLQEIVFSSESFKDELLWWMIYAKEDETARTAQNLYLSLTKDFPFKLWNKNLTQKELSQMIDDTLLGPGISEDRIDQKVQDALENGSGLVMLMPLDIPIAAESLKKRNAKKIKLGAVVGFPLSGLTETKLIETEYALKHGATEIDMVMDHAALVRGKEEEVLKDIQAVVQKAKNVGGPKVLVKVIIETGILTEEEKIRATRIVRESGAESVKTSTGFFGGATTQDVALLRLISGPDFMVKASGGIQKLEDAKKVIESGADRLGVSKSAVVLSGFPKDGKVSIELKQIKDLLERVWELREKVMKSRTHTSIKRIEAYGAAEQSFRAAENRENDGEVSEKMDQHILEKIRRVDLPSQINLVNLRPKLASWDLEKMTDLMAQYGFRAAIVSVIHVEELSRLFRERGIDRPIIAAVGYPFNTLTSAKELEAKHSIDGGAHGIKTVMDIASLRRGMPGKALEDLRQVVNITKEISGGKAEVDVILDAALLKEGVSELEGDRLVLEATKIILQSGADGISLNTGWKGKAEARDIRVVREVVGKEFRVAASGGVKTLQKTMELLEAGADQVSSSDASDILFESAKIMRSGSKTIFEEKSRAFEIAA